MYNWIKVKDDFLPNHEEVIEAIKNTTFGDHTHNGKNYTGVGNVSLPVKALMEEVLGIKVIIKDSHLRLGNKKTPLTHYIHADSPEAEYAMVLHLTTPACKSGTAFWEHKYTGLSNLPKQYGKALFDLIDQDTWNESKWNLNYFVESKANRAVFFDSSLFHSRWPKHLPIEESETPRLVFVAFFDVIRPEEVDDGFLG